MANRLVFTGQQFFDSSGNPLNGGTLNFYSVGTLIAKNVYTDEALTIGATSSHTLSAAGRAQTDLWGSGKYREILKDSAGATIEDDDPVYVSASETGIQNGAYTHITAANVTGTADAILLVTTPPTTAYADGQKFSFISEGANTGAVTVNVNSLGAKNLTKNGSTALVAGDIPSGAWVEIGYDGTRFQLLGVNVANAVLTSGNQSIAGDKTFSGTLAMTAKPINEAVRVDVASAATTNLTTAASNYVRITGTETITAITLSDGFRRHVVAGGAFSITTGASLLIDGIASGVTYTFTAGDTFDVFGEASSVVRISGVTLPGAQVGYARTTSTTAASTSTQIPLDNSIPQNTEGTAYASLDTPYTVKYANSLLEVDVFIPLCSMSADVTGIVALFRDTTADAVQAMSVRDFESSIYLKAVVAASATGSTTFKLRYGTNTGSDTLYLLSVNGTEYFSTSDIAVMTVREIRQ